jgi:hypothetical protein
LRSKTRPSSTRGSGVDPGPGLRSWLAIDDVGLGGILGNVSGERSVPFIRQACSDEFALLRKIEGKADKLFEPWGSDRS